MTDPTTARIALLEKRIASLVDVTGLQAMKADAERYRFLRDNKHEVRMWSPDGESNRVRAWLSGERLDAAIDAVREDT